MAELRAGGMALIVGGQQSVGVIGVTVQLIELFNPYRVVRIPGQPLFRNSDSVRWLVFREGIKTTLSNGGLVKGYGLVLPQHLIPIDGDDFTHEDEREKELVNG